MSNHKFFLRFYKQSEELIEECCQKLVKDYTPSGYVHNRNQKLSVNPFGPTPVEVLLSFDSRADLEAFMADDEARALYQSYATGEGLEGSLRRVQPGDVSFER